MIHLICEKAFAESSHTETQQMCGILNQADAVVTNIEKKKAKKSSGKLFSLSKLQGELGKEYKMSLKESLAIVQSLYEKGFVTYPRINTEYLAENEKDKMEVNIQT